MRVGYVDDKELRSKNPVTSKNDVAHGRSQRLSLCQPSRPGIQSALFQTSYSQPSISDTEKRSIRRDLFAWKFCAMTLVNSNLIKSSPSTHLSAIVVNILGLVMPLAMLQVYDRIIPNGASATLGAIIIILIVTAIIEAVLRIARLYVDNFNAAKFSHNVLVDAFGRIMNPLGEDIGLLTPRKAIDRLEAIARLGNFLGGPARQIAIDLPFSLIFFVAIAIIGGWLVLIPISIAVIFGAITFGFGRALERAVEQKDQQDTRVFDFVNEVLSGITTIKGLSTERMMMRRFERLGRTSAKNTFDQIVAADRAQIIAGTLGNVTTISIATVGAAIAMEGSITIGTLAACSLLAGRAVQPTLRLAGIWNEHQRSKLTLREAKRIARLPQIAKVKTSEVLSCAPNVCFSDVNFSLGDGALNFDGLDFEITPNSIVSFCGPDGVGKSCIAKLISGLMQPASGQITINGINAAIYRTSYSNSIGYVSPETEIFHGTILENLTLHGSACDHETALQTCELLALDNEIFSFADGYATELGGTAVETLSKGFIQRLIIARALAQRPRVLILDEAQTFIDARSDQKLRDYLKDLQFDSTIILITNRRDYLDLSDTIFDVLPGEVRRRSRTKSY